ncbi:hypothetical protein FBR02_00060 [Anaerolineae bacterium CFX9]|nr:hypothetical protein [Anaerolineae bacterium]MDL1899145.1 hypothetical protein [Anaerolineae bacterium CFX9]NOG48746.1 hypothetical protein [Chloroflexota bacterium]GIK76120.1 MAG: hypothetical protein BroJett021_51080 [Chloroflexota bacterium]
MRYWDDMRTKYGFNDGGAVPDGAEVYRAIYIRAVNQLAEQLGSGVRATAYDRVGVHNWCLILFYDVNDLSGRTPDELAEPLDLSSAEVVEPDEAMDEAIQQASLLDLDSFVQVSIDLSDDFESFVAALYPVNEGDPLVAEVNGQPQHIYPGGQVRLVREVNAFNGTQLPVGSEYAVTWIDHHPPLVGLAAQSGDPICVMTAPDAVVVVEIPSEIRAESENCDPIPPFHLSNMDDETLDEYGEFYDWNAAQIAMQRAARERGQSVQIVNGYSNTVTSCDPDESE